MYVCMYKNRYDNLDAVQAVVDSYEDGSVAQPNLPQGGDDEEEEVYISYIQYIHTSTYIHTYIHICIYILTYIHTYIHWHRNWMVESLPNVTVQRHH